MLDNPKINIALESLITTPKEIHLKFLWTTTSALHFNMPTIDFYQPEKITGLETLRLLIWIDNHLVKREEPTWTISLAPTTFSSHTSKFLWYHILHIVMVTLFKKVESYKLAIWLIKLCKEENASNPHSN